MQSMITKGEGVPDFILMEQLTEQALLDNLKIRYDKRVIYVCFHFRSLHSCPSSFDRCQSRSAYGFLRLFF